MAGYPRKQNRKNSGDKEQGKMARDIDGLAEFDTFVNTVLPKLRRMLADDKSSARDMISFTEKEMAARMITIALTEKDPKVAMTAIKDVMDRSMGKATETHEVTTRFENVSDDDLERMIAQEEAMLKDERTH